MATDTCIGIIGVGGFGRFVLRQYRALPGVRIGAIAGTQPEKYAALAREFNIPFHTTDWRALLDRPELDIIYLATPPHLRGEIAIPALEAGKHVFCEKPLALTLAEADAMLAAAERSGARLGINFVMRYSALYTLAKTIADARLLGAPQRFLFENTAGDLPAEHWFWDPRRSGGIPVEHGVHFFDIFTALFGPGTLCWAGRSCRRPGVADKWLAVLRYGTQQFGSFYHAFDKPSPIERTWAVLDFEYGSITLDGWIPTRLTIDGLATTAESAGWSAVLPLADVVPLFASESLPVNGHTAVFTHRVTAAVAAGDKEAVYAQATQDALLDFIAWTRDARHRPRVTGADGRTALATTLEVIALAEHDD